MIKVAVVYTDGKKELTYLTSRSISWVIAIIKHNNKQGIRTLALIKE
jgi:hypothetical protein